MRIKITTESLDVLSRDGLAIGVFLDERPPKGHCGFVDWRLNGMISRELARGHITAAFMEKIMVASPPRIPASRILLLGMGAIAELTDDKIYQAGYHISETMDCILCDDFALSLPAAGRCHLPVPAITESLIRGCFDYLSRDIEKWANSSTTIVADESYLDDVVSGLHNFRINARDISIIEIEGAPEKTIY